MSRKVLVALRTEAGVTYGRVVKATEMMDIQDFAHTHVEHVVRDKLMRNATLAESAGFNYTLPGGMVVSIGEGHAIDVQGRSFDTLPTGTDTSITIPAAHVSLPRIDLIFATLVADQDEEPGVLPFRRLLSTSELGAGADPYPITDDNVNTRRDNVAVVSVRQGLANASPAAPALGANEVPLYQVRVDAGVTVIASNKVTDVRRQMKSLADALVRLDSLEANPAIVSLNEVIDDRFAALFGVTSNTGLVGVYNDAANSYTLAGVAATAGVMGMMPAADKAKLDAATDLPTASTLVKRDANGDAQYRRLVSTVATGTSPLQVASTTEVANLNANKVQGQDLAALDVRFVNAGSDDTMAARLKVLPDGSQESVQDIFTGRVALEAHVQATGTGEGRGLIGRASAAQGAAVGIYGKGTSGGNGSAAYGVRGEANINTGSAPVATTFFGVYGAAAGGGTNHAGYFNGNVTVVGALSKGSGTFRIDHPLDPAARTLLHGFVESNTHGLIYPVSVTLVGGVAEMSLDEILGMTPGTLAKIAQNFMIVSAYSSGTAHITAGVDTLVDQSDTRLNVTSDDEADASTVNLLIFASRADPYIKSSPDVDAFGMLIVEVDKLELTTEDEAKLDAVTVEVDADSDLVGETVEEVVPELIGKVGFPYHQAVVEGAVAPTRNVTFVAREE